MKSSSERQPSKFQVRICEDFRDFPLKKMKFVGAMTEIRGPHRHPLAADLADNTRWCPGIEEVNKMNT